MKKALTLILICMVSNAFAGYLCQGLKGTQLEQFKIYELSESNIETSLDGSLDSTHLNNGHIGYVYNNGCDNEIYFKLSKVAAEYLPETFNMKVDYLTEDQVLTDSEVVCHKQEL